jgi:hypothetical protein
VVAGTQGLEGLISGSQAFLLAAPVVTYLIQQLPNANKCTRYVFKDVSDKLFVQKFLSPDGEESGEN